MPPAWKLPFILTQGWEVRRVYATSLDIPFSDPRLGGQGVTVPSSVFFHPLPDGLYGKGRFGVRSVLSHVLRPSALLNWGTGVTPTPPSKQFQVMLRRCLLSYERLVVI